MANVYLYILWGFLYLSGAVLGFLPQPEGFLKGISIVATLAFFVPPAVLIFRGVKEKNSGLLRFIRNLAVVWLSGALLMLILNIASVYFSETTGQILYYGLILLTSPMVCSRNWLLVLFLWACVLMASLQALRKQKTT